MSAATLTLPDSIAWLLNVRGGDVDCTPLPLSFALLEAGGAVQWFVDPAKVGENVRGYLDPEVAVHGPEAFGGALDGLRGARVRVDPETAPAWVFQHLRAAGAEIVPGTDPCQLPKAKKNAVELAGARAAHRRDGAALTRFLAWLSTEAVARAADGGLSEQEAVDKLLAFRSADPLFRQPSFETIAGSGGLSLSITDAPVIDANIAEVWVRFTEVIIHPADGSGDIVYTVEDASDPNNIKPYREIELKALVGGKTSLLGDIALGPEVGNDVRQEMPVAGKARTAKTGDTLLIRLVFLQALA